MPAEHVAITFHPYLIETAAGETLEAEWGRISVPENRNAPSSQSIDLAIVRLRGQGKINDTPIFYLQGGPGVSLLNNLHVVSGLLPAREDLGDVILLEPRGVGHSRPRLDCPGTYDLPLDQPADYETALDGHREYIARAVDFWRGRGVDLAGYNAREMAADVDAVRRALGYDRIVLMGGSFGSHHGLAVMRFYGEFIERAVLWGVEGPDHTLKLPSLVQQKLETLNLLIQQDRNLLPYAPDLLGQIARVSERLERHPVTVLVPGNSASAKKSITVGKYDLQWATADSMGSTPFLRAMPALFAVMADGDLTWLAKESMRLRTGLRSNLTYELVDCASGASAGRRAAVEAQAPATLLGSAINETLFGVCSLLDVPDLGERFRSDLKSDVPTLLVAGSLDPRTPLENARELLAGLANGLLLVVEGASHDLAWRGPHVPTLMEIRDAFLAGEQVSPRTLSVSFQFDPVPIGPGGKGPTEGA